MSEQPLDLLTRAIDQMSAVIGNARFDESGNDLAAHPTPCPQWDVRALAEHVIMDVDRFTLAAGGGRPDWSALVPGVEGDWREAFDAKTPGLIAEWSKIKDFDTPVRMPIGEVPQSFVVKQQLAEFAVHAWDLARSTGQQPEWDEEIAETALDWSRMSLKPEFRGADKPFGAAQPEPAGATPTQALIAWFGRDPHWAPQS
jgi:uncharacterized protein (TIGR03086 family)